MNLNIKATGTREEIAAMLRELATKLESGQTPDGADESLAEPIRVEHPETGERAARLIAEPRKRLVIAPQKPTERKKSEPLKRAAMCLKRAIAKATELVAALREVFPAATGAACMVIEDLLADAVKLSQKLVRLEWLESTK